MQSILKNEPIKMIGRPIPQSDFDKFGINLNEVSTTVSSFEELRSSIPNIVVAECKFDCEFIQDHFRKQKLSKKNKYVMSISVYRQIYYNESKNLRLLRPSNKKFLDLYKPYTGQDLTNKKIMIWRTGGIGDLLFIQPSMIYLKKLYPSCKIYFACGPQYRPMVETWECIDELVDLPFRDVMLSITDYHVMFEGVIERCELAKTENAYVLFSKWMGLDIPTNELIPKQTPKQKLVFEVKNILSKWNIDEKSFILAQLRSSSPIRTPHPDVWGKLINDICSKGYKVVITDSQRFKDGINEFINVYVDKKYHSNIFNFAQYSPSLDYTIALASLVKLVVCIDSSLAHIAPSVGTKSIPIYGPFPSDVRVSTYGDLSEPIDCNFVECAPCYTHGNKPCQNSIAGHGICFNKFPVDMFLEKVTRSMES